MTYRLLLVISFIILVPSLVFAQTQPAQAPAAYELMQPIGPVQGTPDLPTYLGGLFTVLIAIAGVLAVLMVVICAIQMIGSENINTRGEKKKCIVGALFGVILALGSWVTLNTINTELVSMRLVLTDPAETASPTITPSNDTFNFDTAYFFNPNGSSEEYAVGALNDPNAFFTETTLPPPETKSIREALAPPSPIAAPLPVPGLGGHMSLPPVWIPNITIPVFTSPTTGGTTGGPVTGTLPPTGTIDPPPPCSASSPPATLRHTSNFDNFGSNPPPGSSLVTLRTGLGSNGDAYLNSDFSISSQSWLAGIRATLQGSGNLMQTTQVARAGAGSMRVQVGVPNLRPPQCLRYRAEISILDPNSVKYVWDDGVSHWTGFSVMPTKFGAPDAASEAWTLFQVHHPATVKNGANALTLTPEMKGGVPSFSLRVITNGGVEQGCAVCGTTEVWSAPMKMNQWEDFVFNFTLSTRGQGYYHLYHNGQLVYSRTGVTNVQATTPSGAPVSPRESMPSRIGIYGPSCEYANGDHFREAYFDELRTAAGCDGYDLVDPAKH